MKQHINRQRNKGMARLVCASFSFLILFASFSFCGSAYAQSPANAATQSADPNTDPNNPFNQAPASNNAGQSTNPNTDPSNPFNHPQAPSQQNSSGSGGTQSASGTPVSSAGGAPFIPQIIHNPNPANGLTTNVLQAQEQNIDIADWTEVEKLLYADGPTNGSTQSNYVTSGIQGFYDQAAKSWFPNAGQLIAKWVMDFFKGWLAPLNAMLIKGIAQVAYNYDVSDPTKTNAFTTQIRQMAHGVQDLANDLLLLFFVLAIWRYWSTASHKGGTLAHTVGRIIVAAGMIIAWPTIYHYVIMISNSAINLFIPYDMNGNYDNQYAEQLGQALLRAFVSAFAPITVDQWIPSSLGDVMPLMVGNTFIYFLQIVLGLLIGIAILFSAVAFFAMKIIQLVLILSAYVFAPFFLCLLASPDTSRYASDFIKTFIEATLWTFIWAGFIKLLSIVLNTPVV